MAESERDPVRQYEQDVKDAAGDTRPHGRPVLRRDPARHDIWAARVQEEFDLDQAASCEREAG